MRVGSGGLDGGENFSGQGFEGREERQGGLAEGFGVGVGVGVGVVGHCFIKGQETCYWMVGMLLGCDGMGWDAIVRMEDLTFLWMKDWDWGNGSSSCFLWRLDILVVVVWYLIMVVSTVVSKVVVVLLTVLDSDCLLPYLSHPSLRDVTFL